LFYYSIRPPASPPDLGAMSQLSMALVDGDVTAGAWAVDVPNPAVDVAAGDSVELYYLIVAGDDDDAVGSCDHVTQAPAEGAFRMCVTNPGGAGGAGLCERCTADVQCGGAADLCVRVGAAGDGFCLAACAGDGDSPGDYTCVREPVSSVGGANARQCVPQSGSCADPGGAACPDDVLEDNDSPAQADAQPALEPGVHELVSCELGDAGDDEDWFRIELLADAAVELRLEGGSRSDLDLAAYDGVGALLGASTSLDSSEGLAGCLPRGRYYVRVFALGAEYNPYRLSYTASPMRCALTGTIPGWDGANSSHELQPSRR
jgi:hypothetical protein